ncbi:hypothetical protein [Tetragenococcus koreensis]|uniref:hypothetical protein n=1 Tax=Tetragenococcus koreensis TaxID=290335 RepID=UPI000F516B32|nr:hypothetical protein [Tetragenococcus koreensis]AYW44755.1 hypothetical protein C7K43_01735 [Tetragenococcus koreensis]GEN91902.1 hypothetical protein TKO01_19480 [Tetragenococcus koreensis]
MDDGILLSIIYGIYLESFPQKWCQKMKNNRLRKFMHLPFYYHDLENLEIFCEKLTKQGFNSKEIESVTQNLEVKLNQKWEKTKFFINNSLRIIMFCITGLAVVFAWTFLSDNVPYGQRYEYLNIVTLIINVGVLFSLLIMIYLANKRTKEENLLSVLKDAQIIMKRSKP